MAVMLPSECMNAFLPWLCAERDVIPVERLEDAAPGLRRDQQALLGTPIILEEERVHLRLRPDGQLGQVELVEPIQQSS